MNEERLTMNEERLTMNGVRAKVLKALLPKGVWAAGCSCLTVAVGWLHQSRWKMSRV